MERKGKTKQSVSQNKGNIQKVNIRDMFWYFIIFSIIGLFIETLFCYVTTGNIESRKGLIWGPFCPIYGVGASLIILALNKYQHNDFKIFFFGGIIGSIIEYVISFLLEAMYGTRFWDYSHFPFDLNGRICITYTIYWAILALILMKIIRPATDHVLAKIPKKLKKIIEIVLVIFLSIDGIVTIWATTVYKNRALDIYYNRNTGEKNENIISQIEENYFSNIRMYETFPNLRVRDENGKELFIRDILKEAGKI